MRPHPLYQQGMTYRETPSLGTSIPSRDWLEKYSANSELILEIYARDSNSENVPVDRMNQLQSYYI
jgi:hypothetical protein